MRCEHTYITWYAGKTECAANQRTYVARLTNGSIDAVTTLPWRSGNSVLWFEGERLLIAYARLRRQPAQTPVKDWLAAQLFIAELDPTTLTIGGDQLSIGNYLSRCSPINHNQQTLIPLYSEAGMYCVLVRGLWPNYEVASKFGTNMIQPAIWEQRGCINALNRNFHNHKSIFSRLIQFTPELKPLPAEKTTLYNNNSSLAVCADDNLCLVMWNNTRLPRRDHLTLGVLHYQQVLPLLDFGVGSYPTIAMNQQKIAIAYSIGTGIIYGELRRN